LVTQFKQSKTTSKTAWAIIPLLGYFSTTVDFSRASINTVAGFVNSAAGTKEE
jgi:hypothetical protein